MKQGKYSGNIVLFLIISLSFFGCSSVKQHSANITVPEKTGKIEEIKKVKVSQFILGPGDEVEIMVWRQEDLSRTVRVSFSGTISYPPLGEIQASGLNLVQLRDKLRQGLLKYLVEPKISITVTSVRSQKIFVLGEVTSPGVLLMDIPITALEAILQVGGFTTDAEQRTVLLIRGNLKKPILKSLNLKKVYTRGELKKNILLEKGDILYIPRTRIANIERFFGHLSAILSPIVELERGIVLGPSVGDVFKGETPETTLVQ